MGHFKHENRSTADTGVPTLAVDLLIYYKNNTSEQVVGSWLLSVPEGLRASSTPGCAQVGRAAGVRRAAVLSLHMADKGLHQLDQRLLTLRAGLGQRGGLALR